MTFAQWVKAPHVSSQQWSRLAISTLLGDDWATQLEKIWVEFGILPTLFPGFRLEKCLKPPSLHSISRVPPMLTNAPLTPASAKAQCSKDGWGQHKTSQLRGNKEPQATTPREIQWGKLKNASQVSKHSNSSVNKHSNVNPPSSIGNTEKQLKDGGFWLVG